MPAITFPKTSFRANIRGYTRKDGFGLDACLWRELLQNARDAYATRVDCTLSETDTQIILTCRDNGTGMDWDTLEKGMLTYSGSIKQAGAAGGFGMAKVIIAFSSDYTLIRTKNNHVRVDGITYEQLPATDYLNGTEVTIACPKSEQPDMRLEPTEEGLKFLLARCDMKGMDVYLNGKLIPDCWSYLRSEDVAKEFTFQAKAYSWKKKPPFVGLDGSTNVAVVRHRGIWVCDLPVPSDAKGAILIELDGEAKDCLNDTRTNLSSYFQRMELEKWMSQLSAGAQSTLKTKRWSKRYDGFLFATQQQVVNRVEETASSFGHILRALAGSLGDDVIAKVGMATESTQNVLGASTDTAKVALERLGDNSSPMAFRQLMWRPALMIVNEREEAVRHQYLPESMGSRVRGVLQVWAELIRQMLIWKYEYRPFGVGFIFSDDTAAQFRKEKDGSIWFLINPTDFEGNLRFKLSSEESRNEMVVSSAHEVAHCAAGSASIHGDTWSKEYDSLVKMVLDKSVVINRIWKRG